MRTVTSWVGGVLSGMIAVVGARAVLAGGDEVAGSAAGGPASPTGTAPMTIHACVNNLSGAMTIVSADKVCPNNASALHWRTEPQVVAKARGVLRLGPTPVRVGAGAIGATDVMCDRGEVATGFASGPAGRMQLVDALPLAEAGRERAVDGYQGGGPAATVGAGMTVTGYRFRAKNPARVAYDGSFGGVLCQVP